MYRIARFAISPELIIDALHMPKETLIYDIRRHPVFLDTLEIVVIHKDLPEVKIGHAIPEITPQLTEIQWDWNVD